MLYFAIKFILDNLKRKDDYNNRDSDSKKYTGTAYMCVQLLFVSQISLQSCMHADGLI